MGWGWEVVVVMSVRQGKRGWGWGGGCHRRNMKYVFKCKTPQQDLAGNMCALENGNDLLFKEVSKYGGAKYK